MQTLKTLSVEDALTYAIGLTDWEFRRQKLLTALDLGILPDTAECIQISLKRIGFVPKAGKCLEHGICGFCDFLREKGYDEGTVAIVKCYGSPWGKGMVPIFHTNMGFEPGLEFPGNPRISDAWVFKPSETTRACKTNGKTASFTPPPNGDWFRYLQVNGKRRTGDCVVRAISAAMDKPWEDTLKRLYCYSDRVNCPPVFEQMLADCGFTRHDPIKKNGRLISASELCRRLSGEFHDGQRIVAYIGQSHLTAILPSSDGIYRVYDSWDCSLKPAGTFWFR